MSLPASNAAVYLTEAASMIGALTYAIQSEHGKISDAMTRAVDRAIDRVSELT